MVAIQTSENDLKERISIGLVTLIAARAGCQVVEPPVDRVSVDVAISPVAGAPVTIEAQLKATSALAKYDNEVRFDLDVKNYDDLRDTQVGNARILIVIDLNEAQHRWVRLDGKRLIFSRCAYWVSLYGRPPTTNRTTIRVSIPSTQILTPSSLNSIIEQRYLRIQSNHGGL